jgi:hypothetical protein
MFERSEEEDNSEYFCTEYGGGGLIHCTERLISGSSVQSAKGPRLYCQILQFLCL